MNQLNARSERLESRLLMSRDPITIAPPLESFLGGGHSQVMLTMGEQVTKALPNGNTMSVTDAAEYSLLRAAWGKMPG